MPGRGFGRPCSQDGFTLTELLVVVAIVGVMAVAVAPTFKEMMACQRLNAAARSIGADLQLARMRAVSQNTEYRITFSSTTDEYTLCEWDGAACVQQVGLVRKFSDLDNPYSFIGVDITSPNGSITFESKGTSPGGITIALDSQNCGKQKTISVNWIGRVQVT